MGEQHRMRVLITGVDADGRSCVVGTEEHELSGNPDHPGFWSAEIARLLASPPPRPPGRGSFLEIGLGVGEVGWHVIDYSPSLAYEVHHTDTVDLDLVLEGSIELTLDDGVHVLQTGDGVVMNGVDHAWRSGLDGCRLNVIQIGTPPPA